MIWTNVCPNCSSGWTLCSPWKTVMYRYMLTFTGVKVKDGTMTDAIPRTYTSNGHCSQLNAQQCWHWERERERAFSLFRKVHTGSRHFYSASLKTTGDAISLMYQSRWSISQNVPHTSTTYSTSKMPCLDLRTVCTTSSVAINVNTWFLHNMLINIESIIVVLF